MPVITIRGQLGSGAPEIAKLVAGKLDTDYVDSEIIANVAELLNCGKEDVIAKEMPPGGLIGRIASAMRRVPDMTESNLNDVRYFEGLNSIIEELALTGSIIIRGRGSQFILRNWPGALHVLIVLPLNLRVRRVALEMNIDEDKAKKEISRFDGSRRQFIKTYFKAELEDPVNYDLVINTEHLNFEAAASIIVNTVPFKPGN